MDEIQTPALMTQAEYARHRDCSRQYVSRLAREGRLVLRDDLVDALESDRILGPPGAEDEDEVLSGTDRSRAELRLIEAQAALTELKLRERAGELVEREEFIRRTADLWAGLREKLLALPFRVADRVVNLKAEREIAIVISGAIEDELTQFAESVKRALSADSSDGSAGNSRDNAASGGSGVRDGANSAAADDAQ